MNVFNRLTLNNKVRLPIGILAILLVILTVTTMKSSNELTKQAVSLGENPLIAIGLVLNADRDFYQALVAEREYIEAIRNKASDEVLKEIDASRQENQQQTVDRISKALTILSETSQKQYSQTLTDKINAWIKISDQVVTLAKQGQVAQASSLSHGNSSDTFQMARDIIDEVGAQVEADAAEILRKVILEKNQSFWSAIILTTIVLIIFATITFWLPRNIGQEILIVSNQLKEIATGEGDLTKRLTIRVNDQFGELSSNFNAVMDRLHSVMSQVSQMNSILHDNAYEISEISKSNIANAKTKDTVIDQVVTAVHEMATTSNEIASNSAQGHDSAEASSKQIEEGVALAKSTNTDVNRLAKELSTASDASNSLNEEAKNIASVLDVIRGIAEQTNLLALNAAIEAARAGEQGRGFAVVADEVRSLASKTQQSTEDIQNRIERLQAGVNVSVETMNRGVTSVENVVINVDKVSESFSQIEAAIGNVYDVSTQIATSTEEQSKVADEINHNLVDIANYSKEDLSNAEKFKSITISMNEQVDNLSLLIKGYKL